MGVGNIKVMIPRPMAIKGAGTMAAGTKRTD